MKKLLALFILPGLGLGLFFALRSGHQAYGVIAERLEKVLERFLCELLPESSTSG